METAAGNIFAVEAAAKAFEVYNVYTALVASEWVDLMNNNLVLNVGFDDIKVAVVNQPPQRLPPHHPLVFVVSKLALDRITFGFLAEKAKKRKVIQNFTLNHIYFNHFLKRTCQKKVIQLFLIGFQ